MGTKVDVGIESGAKRALACALDWPGWCRGGRDEASALDALAAYIPRYAAAVRGSGMRFPASAGRDSLSVAERTEGNATTDYGAPDGVFSSDERKLDARMLARLVAFMDATWSTFDDAVEGARGIELRKGPRGGGRELDAIVDHVVQAEAGYGRRLAARVSLDGDDPWSARRGERAQIREALTPAAIEGMPETGPRGGKLWTPRRFVRRAAWHVLDHAWEIQDRAHPSD
jgi:hypothetical protein